MNQTQSIESRTRNIAVGTIALYLVIVAAMALTGHFTFFTKTIVVPMLFVVAFATKRFLPFVKEWAVFLSLVILFDSLRGYVFYLTVRFELPVYMNYIIELERFLCGGEVATVWLQKVLWDANEIGLLEKTLTVAHGSHFLMFLFFGLFVWYTRYDQFGKFKSGMLLVMYLGLLGYFLIPTVPPWMASWRYERLPYIYRMAGDVYNTSMPELRLAFDSNPVAAMPSLHTAFPVFLNLVAVQHYRWRGLFLVPYSLLVLFALVYGGEHYVVDIIAGALLSAGVFLLVYKTNLLGKIAAFFQRTHGQFEGPLFRVLNTEVKRKLAITFFILVVGELAGQIVLSEPLEFEPTEDFIERELVGKSRLANLYKGRFAFKKGDFETAQQEYELAARTSEDPETRLKARTLLAEAAFKNRDYDTVINTLEALPWERIAGTQGHLLAMTYYNRNELDRALSVFDKLVSSFPQRPRFAFLRSAFGYLRRVTSRDEVMVTIEALRSRRDDEDAQYYAELLTEMIAPDAKRPTRAEVIVHMVVTSTRGQE